MYSLFQIIAIWKRIFVDGKVIVWASGRFMASERLVRRFQTQGADSASRLELNTVRCRIVEDLPSGKLT